MSAIILFCVAAVIMFGVGAATLFVAFEPGALWRYERWRYTLLGMGLVEWLMSGWLLSWAYTIHQLLKALQ